ncbi:MAG: serine kinase [Roseovarius sp.]|nr:serine kinase [Roseovarius sp.]
MGDRSAPEFIMVHATCVAHAGRAALIRGAAGRGKSGLALHLMALGAGLVADDRTRLWRQGDQVFADAPASIAGRIEARGVGILQVPPVGPQPLALVVDLDLDEQERLPPLRHEAILDVDLFCVRKSAFSHFPAAIMLYLAHGVVE